MKFFIFSLFISFNLYGDIQKKDVKLLENINFMTEEYPPFNFFSKGEVTGFGVDILLELIKELKINKSRKDIKLLPWARGYKYVQNPEKRNMLFLMVASIPNVQILAKIPIFLGVFSIRFFLRIWNLLPRGRKILQITKANLSPLLCFGLAGNKGGH